MLCPNDSTPASANYTSYYGPSEPVSPVTEPMRSIGGCSTGEDPIFHGDIGIFIFFDGSVRKIARESFDFGEFSMQTRY